MKRLLLLSVALVFAIAAPAGADPGPTDEVEIILGDCSDGTTILRAHNTTEGELGWLIRIDGALVDQGRLAPDERVERVFEVALGESHFFRIRLGLPGEGTYYSTEGTTDRTDCPSPTTPPPTTTTPPPTTTTPPPGGGNSTPPSVGGGGGTSVGGESGTNEAPLGTAFTGTEDVPWLVAAMLALLIIGTFTLRVASSDRPARADDGSR